MTNSDDPRTEGLPAVADLGYSEAAGELDAAEERLKHMSFYQVEYAEAVHELELARARLRAAEMNHGARA